MGLRNRLNDCDDLSKCVNYARDALWQLNSIQFDAIKDDGGGGKY